MRRTQLRSPRVEVHPVATLSKYVRRPKLLACGARFQLLCAGGDRIRPVSLAGKGLQLLAELIKLLVGAVLQIESSAA